ncbi:MAG: helix-turn-helix transcriptional regulator [Ignavibacteria bacterium]|nr:helix-turn-helix transcriptional regulator [Ignavibacteria bacterium]
MILRRYPESIQNVKDNFIVHFTAESSELSRHITPLTLKCSMKGLEKFNTPERTYGVNTGNFLILNEGQQCESLIENSSESFSIYFKPEFANTALKSLITPSDRMLNHSFKTVSQPVTFFEKLYPHNYYLSPVIMKMRLASKFNFDDENWLKERYFELLENLLKLHRELYKDIEKLPPVKLSTKSELYRRVSRAKEYIDMEFTDNLTLKRISKEACLSQFHFLRIFKSVYKQTPHQYLTKKRIEKAVELLKRTDMPVTGICFEIGFESVSSFSIMFKTKFGLPPETFRESYRKHMAKFKMFK